MEKDKLEELKLLSAKIRKDVLEMLEKRGYGHMGGSLSIVELMSVLYGKQLRYDAKNPDWEERDMVVLSKGHSGPAWYSVLAEKGFFDREWLFTLNDGGTKLPSHPDRLKTPGVDMTTGSLGQGLSAANGMAIAGKMDKKNYRVYCILGDGEIEEGQIWEAAMSSNKYKLDNLCVIVDNNNLQIDGSIEEVMSLTNIDEKFKSFGFQIIKIDGHDIDEILKAFEVAKNIKGKPTCIIAKTIKGKGISYMENQVGWHGKAPNKEEYEEGLRDVL